MDNEERCCAAAMFVIALVVLSILGLGIDGCNRNEAARIRIEEKQYELGYEQVVEEGQIVWKLSTEQEKGSE